MNAHILIGFVLFLIENIVLLLNNISFATAQANIRKRTNKMLLLLFYKKEYILQFVMVIYSSFITCMLSNSKVHLLALLR